VVKIHRKPVTVKGTESCLMPLENNLPGRRSK